MSNTKHSDSGPLKELGGRALGARNPAAPARAVRSAMRKMSVVLELIRGADLKATSRKYGVTAATLSEWRGAFLAAGEKGLKIWQEGLVDEQGSSHFTARYGSLLENGALMVEENLSRPPRSGPAGSHRLHVLSHCRPVAPRSCAVQKAFRLWRYN